jgi:Skp family chaperone for outer membrane proteins
MRMRAVLLALLLAGPACAQTPPVATPSPDPILTIDQDRLFSHSVFGKASQEKLAAEQATLLAENREIEAALEAEERALTDQRKTLPAAEFREKAAAFDVKVEGIRAAQVEKDRRLRQSAEEDERRFYEQAFPIIGQLMQDMGASVILDKQTIILSLQRVDVTDAAIVRIDAVLGDGSAPPVPAPTPQP